MASPYFLTLRIAKSVAMPTCPIFTLWYDIQDIIGYATLWPHNIRKNFWNRSAKHFDRICLCAFCYINGLNPELLLDWLKLLEFPYSSRKHVKDIFTYFCQGRYSNLYQWNVYNKRYEDLNGKPIYYGNYKSPYTLKGNPPFILLLYLILLF